MNKNYRNQDNSDDENRFAMRKTTYWEIYGVQRFSYRGRRKYTPLLHQSFDGGMIITNDVFGLTIRQFDRMYKACLEKRKIKEPWILNLRYPDKSSKEYLQYLENCTDCNTGDLFWRGNDPKEKYLYEQLVQIVGTEIDIRKRQRLFILFDMYINACMLDRTHISSGSLAEGIDLPDSDIDIMYVIRKIYVIQNACNTSIKQPKNRIEFVMETDIDHPGFTRLKRNDKHLPVNHFLNIFKTNNCNVPLYSHGPGLSTRELTVDIAFCLRSKYLPQDVNSWSFRHRWQWPPHFVIDKIIHYGCLIVPIGPKTVSDDISLWRFSFSVAEKMLVHSFNFTQYLCYSLLKLMLKRVINTHDEVKDLLCSYFLKTALFWVSEEHDINRFQLTKLSYYFSLCLSKLITWVNICNCPNYFIPEHNMFQGKINKSNNTILLRVLGGIQSGGIDGLIINLFPTDNRSLLVTTSESSSNMLDFLFYRINAIKARETEISISYKKTCIY